MSFNDGVQELLEIVECRRIVDAQELGDVYRLRYMSYLKEGAIAPHASQAVTDRFDGLSNNWIFGIFVDGRLASTIRLGLATAAERNVPAMTTFADVLEPLLAGGERILDPTRFVLDAAAAAKHTKLAYVTLRVAWVVADHLGVDRTLASVRTEHQAFYRRFFGHSLVCPARAYPSLLKPLSLMSLPSHQGRERGYARYPFLRSTKAEFDSLMICGETFGRPLARPRPSADQAREDHAAVFL